MATRALLLTLLETTARSDSGFAVNDRDHALQTATRAERAGADPGISIIGRGFDARVSGPYGLPLADCLDASTARECAAACPTSALRSKLRYER